MAWMWTLVFLGSVWGAPHAVFLTGAGASPLDVADVAQDRDGYLWFGGGQGLARYDGVAVTAAGRPEIRRFVSQLAAVHDGSLWVRERIGGVWRVEGDQTRPVEGPDGADLEEVSDLSADSAGRPCVVWRGRFFCHRTEGWFEPIPLPFPTGTLRRVALGPGGRALAAIGPDVWELTGAGWVRRATFEHHAVDLAWSPHGEPAALAWMGAMAVGDRTPWRVVPTPVGHRDTALAWRDGRWWAATNQGLYRLQAEGLVEVDRRPDGAALLVDREGSLWWAAAGGVVQYPEPETTLYAVEDDIPFVSRFAVADGAGGVWASGWGHLVHFGPGKPEIVAHPRDRAMSLGWGGCRDAAGAFWTGGARWALSGNTPAFELRRWVGGSSTGVRTVDLLGCCAPRSRGGVWALGGETLVQAVGTPPQLETFVAPREPRPNGGAPRVYEDPAGTLWIGASTQVCGATLDAEGRPGGWRCEALPDAGGVSDVLRTPAGHLWLSTSGGGVLSRLGDRWVPLLANDRLPMLDVRELEPARDGGVWVVATGFVGRVRERGALDWEVVEELSPWEGLPSRSATWLRELPDGTLYVGLQHGVARVPAQSRLGARPPPVVVFATARVGGRAVSPEGVVLGPDDGLELVPRALSYRDPAALRYRTVEDGRAFASAELPSLALRARDAGEHTLRVEATLDGVAWSTRPAVARFVVEPRWYAEPRVQFAAALGFFAAGAGAAWIRHRVRMARLAAVAAERASIAADLHDDVGSGLGAIGIHAGLLASGRLARDDADRAARAIETAAEELLTSVRAVVRGLDPKASDTQRLVDDLVDRARSLVPGPVPRLDLVLPPDIPREPISPTVYRHVFGIAAEALHNAARHAGASTIRLHLVPGPRWTLRVADDGGARPGTRVGTGSRTMHARARALGGTLHVSRLPGQGCEVSLSFGIGRGAA